MKKLFLSMILSLLVFGSNEAFAQTAQEGNEMGNVSQRKILIAYYSYSGNTAEVAKAIQAKTGGDLFEIKSDHAYPAEYRPMTEQAKKEIADGFRPKLTTKVGNIAQYDIVFLGSPNWWGTITPQVSSFLESYDLNGKTVVPFITHGGGGVQNTIRDMTAQCKGCRVEQNGWAGYGRRMSGIQDWVDGLKLVP